MSLFTLTNEAVIFPGNSRLGQRGVEVVSDNSSQLFISAHTVMTYDNGLSVPSGLWGFHCSTGFTDPFEFVNGAQCTPPNSSKLMF